MNGPIMSLFPKYLQPLSVEALGEAALEAGMDAVDLIVRDGFWVTPSTLAEATLPFIRMMQRYQLHVKFATTGYSTDQLLLDDTPLRVMADAGIEGFRMGYFTYNPKEELFLQLDRARDSMQRMAELCAKQGIKAVYQVHHGRNMLIAHSMAALYTVRGLPAQHVGIMLDPGNQLREGLENWSNAIGSLGPYLAAIGVKDGGYAYSAEDKGQPSKGWQAQFVPCQEGLTNWQSIGNALQEAGFEGVLNFQPFYHQDRLDELLPTLKSEVAYIRNAFSVKESEVAQ